MGQDVSAHAQRNHSAGMAGRRVLPDTVRPVGGSVGSNSSGRREVST